MVLEQAQLCVLSRPLEVQRPGLLGGGRTRRRGGDVAQRDCQRALAAVASPSGLQDITASLHDAADFGVRNLFFRPRYQIRGGACDLCLERGSTVRPDRVRPPCRRGLEETHYSILWQEDVGRGWKSP